ncbi:MAG TPA: glycerol kinase GlpK [Anaerolineaceae bacterium]|nr:glycerol kinase GlpK [Anaerolineaceae bacterium]
MAQYVAAIDQGTTSTRCIIFDRLGNVVGSDQREHRQILPQPGWVEHAPLELWERTQEVLLRACEKSDLSSGDLAAIGITNQRETTIVWDRETGRPLYNAIAWQDTRTDQICARLAAGGGQDRFRQQTGLPLATYFSGPKIKWIFDNVPGVREAAGRGQALFGTVDSWLVWNLTGGPRGGIHVTDVTNASRTLLMNLSTLDWDPDLLSALEIPAEMLPKICPSSAPLGYTTQVVPGVPIAGILGDQQAALFGQACFSPGEAKNTYGTGCFLLLNTGNQPVHSAAGLLTTVGYQLGSLPAVYCLEGSIAIAGALVQWLRDNLKLISSSGDIEPLARTVEDNGGAYIVPAFSGLFAPYWRSDARGVVTGLTRFINRGHLARAVLEATAYQTADVVKAMEVDSGVPLSTLKVDGGMVKNDLLMQFQADILNVPVVRPRMTETTALGAAYAAGLAVGYWSGMEELRANWAADRTWQPAMDEEVRRNLYAGWRKAVERTFNWVES